MIDEIGIQNFKGIKHLEGLKIKPITIFCGRNSSGKTSILESLLLLKQSEEKNQSLENLILNGKFVRLGSFIDISWQNKPDEPIKMMFKLTHLKFSKDKDIIIEMVYKKKESHTLFDKIDLIELNFIENFMNKKNKYIFIPDPKKYILKWNIEEDRKFKFLKKKGDLAILKKRQLRFPYKSFFNIANNFLFLSFNKFHLSLNTINSIIDEKFNGLVSIIQKLYNSEKISEGDFDNYLEEISTLIKIEKNQKDYELINEILNKIQEIIEKYQNEKNKKKNTVNEFKLLVHDFTSQIQDDIYSIFARLSYYLNELTVEIENLSFIGPLREEPSLRYICEDQKLEIGIRGENAPLIFESEKEVEINEFFHQNKNNFEKIKKKTLSEILNLWANYFKFGNIQSEYPQNSDSMFRFRINEYNLKHVGFGISQVIPILIEGIRMKEKSTLILEQPEIHLHPDLQMRLADFFIAMSLSKRYTIIETHSEHIINRIVRRIVEDNDHILKNSIAVYFIKMGNKGMEFEQIKIDENGIVNWPKGFFDEAMKEQSEIIKLIRQNREKGNNND
ncbi:MAG: DUF3696 domain-containing protein [Candidatus Lokiarchaeota archaeon]|nr:DUF3696 domain-containing protein [Candidatus Harpocratesius repetitus]